MKIIYDKIFKKDRVVIGTNTYNFIVIQGPKDAEGLLKKDRYRSYYTSTKGLLQGMYDKRIKSHFDSISITNLQKAFLGAYNDVIDVSKEIEDVGNKLIKRK
jgi:hypothetical protein